MSSVIARRGVRAMHGGSLRAVLALAGTARPSSYTHAARRALSAGTATAMFVVGGVLACDRPTTPERPDDPVRTALIWGRALSDTVRAVASDSAGVLLVKGVIYNLQPCWTLSASATRRGSALAVDLNSTQNAGTCVNVLAAHRYEVQALDLPPGEYNLKFTYVYRYVTPPNLIIPELDTILTLRAP